MNHIFFLVTSNCNLQCKYCFQEKEPDLHQRKKTTKNVIDALVRYCKENQITNISLFGGEPLLYYDLFYYSVTQLKKIIPSIQIGLITNGTLIDKKILEFIQDNNITIALSLDGDKETHDMMRGGFDNIMSWIGNFKNPSMIYVTLQAAQVSGLYKNIKYIWNLNFAGGVYVNTILDYGWYDEADIAVFEEEYEKAILGMIGGEGVLSCALSMFDLIENYSHKITNCGICDYGLAADWEGTLYPCQRAGELGKEFAIGDLWNGIDKQKNKKIRYEISSKISNPQSVNKYMVARYCPVSLYLKHHSFNGEWPDGYCRIVDIKAKLVAKYYYEIKKYYQNYQKKISRNFSQPWDIPISNEINDDKKRLIPGNPGHISVDFE